MGIGEEAARGAIVVVITDARGVCPAPRRHAASAATAARGSTVGGTAPPRQVRSPLRRSCLLAASLALCVLTRPFVVRSFGAAVTSVRRGRLR